MSRATAPIRWTERARRQLWPSRVHGLALFEAGPGVQASVAALREAIDGLSDRRRTLPGEALERLDVARRALVGASDEDFARAREGVEPRTRIGTALLASAFTSVEPWTRAAAEAYLERPVPEAAIEHFGPFVTDAALTTRLVEASARSPYGLRDRALDLLAHLGEAALEPLALMLLERWSDASVRPVARALSLVGSEAAGRTLLPLLAAPSIKPTARAWARRHRDLALPLLRELCAAPSERALDLAQRHELETVVAPLLHELDPPTARAQAWPPGAPAELTRGRAKTPSYAVVDRLPRLRVAGQELPAQATGRLFAQLARASFDAARACDPESLAALAHATYDAWREAGGSTKDLEVLALVAIAAADALSTRVGEDAEHDHRAGRAARAARLLEALARRERGAAWLAVDRLRRRAEHDKLRRAATEALARAAHERGLSPEALGDQRLPTLGLDARGERTFELADRRLTIGVDDALRPALRLDGEVRRRFPARRKADGQAFGHAKAGWAALRASVRDAAEATRAHLEHAMITERTWTVQGLRALVRHPLARPLLERLLLATAERRLRLAEDGTFADLDDREVTPGADTRIGVVHPAHLSARERDRWSERFADYALVQPFAQLGRAVLTPTDAERAAGRALRVEGAETSWRTLSGLRSRGWTGRAPEHVRVTRLERELDGVGALSLELSPGLHVGSPVGSGPQRIVRARIAQLATLSAVQASEALTEIGRATGGS